MLFSTNLSILWKTPTSQGILNTPSCWNPNSSSASLNKDTNALCPRYSVGMTNLCISSPTHTAKCPFGTSHDNADVSLKDNVRLMNLIPLDEEVLLLVVLEEVEEVPFLETESFFHFFSICWSLTISVILLDFFDSIWGYERRERQKCEFLELGLWKVWTLKEGRWDCRVEIWGNLKGFGLSYSMAYFCLFNFFFRLFIWFDFLSR